MKFTPGPWYLISTEGTDFTAISTSPDTRPGDFDPGREVLGSSEWLRLDDGDANLIAAAPELCEALERMVQKAGKQNWNDMYPDELKAAFAALEKAEGQSWKALDEALRETEG